MIDPPDPPHNLSIHQSFFLGVGVWTPWGSVNKGRGPELVLCNGEDLTFYHTLSAQVNGGGAIGSRNPDFFWLVLYPPHVVASAKKRCNSCGVNVHTGVVCVAVAVRSPSQVFQLVLEFTPRAERLGLDEVYLDQSSFHCVIL